MLFDSHLKISSIEINWKLSNGNVAYVCVGALARMQIESTLK